MAIFFISLSGSSFLELDVGIIYDMEYIKSGYGDRFSKEGIPETINDSPWSILENPNAGAGGEESFDNNIETRTVEPEHEEEGELSIRDTIERDLNSRLLTVDDLEKAILAGNPQVRKHYMSFEGEDIPVYDLIGLPFVSLTTTIDYRKSNSHDSAEVGWKISERLMEDPSIWTETLEEAKKSEGWGHARGGEARGNVISMSIRNSERNMYSAANAGNPSRRLTYGYGHVRKGSVVHVYMGDGRTPNFVGDSEEPDEWDLIAYGKLGGPEGTRLYNEILIRRYDKDGNPLPPDYIMAEDYRISIPALRHAKYHGCPIFNVIDESYVERSKDRAEEILGSINETLSYPEIDKKLSELLSMDKYKGAYQSIRNVGMNVDNKLHVPEHGLEEECREVALIERDRCLDYIKESLENITRNIEADTSNGVSSTVKPEQFDEFRISIRDAHKQSAIEYSYDGFREYEDKRYPIGDRSSIHIQFRLKGSERHIELNIWDGARINELDRYLSMNPSYEYEIEGAESEHFDSLAPAVLGYFDAIRRNRELAK